MFPTFSSLVLQRHPHPEPSAQRLAPVFSTRPRSGSGAISTASEGNYLGHRQKLRLKAHQGHLPPKSPVKNV